MIIIMSTKLFLIRDTRRFLKIINLLIVIHKLTISLQLTYMIIDQLATSLREAFIGVLVCSDP